TMELDPEKIDFLATDGGFDVYMETVKDYFSSTNYLNNGVHTPIDVTDVAGGLDLAALARLDAVLAVDNIEKTDPDFKRYLKYALFHSGIGFHATTLKPYNANISQRIAECPWLQSVTAYATS
ncbi:hypothetical protein M1349_03265, partial [Patescibacteria group bacterium]|nr:hypothetical protein [Patescibacteria group bacterium]